MIKPAKPYVRPMASPSSPLESSIALLSLKNPPLSRSTRRGAKQILISTCIYRICGVQLPPFHPDRCYARLLTAVASCIIPTSVMQYPVFLGR